jgi:iron(II)-dependent oxidoreductase
MDATATTLSRWLSEARARTLSLVEDLSDEQLMGPRLSIVNPLLWEIGHLAWFQEKWVLRHAAGRGPIRADADALYDSTAIPHDVRWDLPLPSRRDTLAYMRAVEDAIQERIARGGLTPKDLYFLRLVVFHEDMHDEAFAYTRQTLGYPPPASDAGAPEAAAPEVDGDAEVPGGRFRLGAERGEPFVFDNEKWAHEVEVAPFRVACRPVTEGELAAFCDDGGYARDDLWSEEGRRWKAEAGAVAPAYWKKEGGAWLRRSFDRWEPISPRRAMVHVGWHEAVAWCRWAGRRLPTEAEWEAAATLEPGATRLGGRKLRFPWGDADPTPDRAALDARRPRAVSVDALPAGEGALGCRQMIGNVWEWTASDFLPYPGFVRDPYAEYSEPWFRTHKVLRGGCVQTTARLIRSTWRNFYTPDRRDVWAGFRTCALA